MRTITKDDLIKSAKKGKADPSQLKTVKSVEPAKSDATVSAFNKIADNIQKNTAVAIALVKRIEQQEKVAPKVEVNVPEAETFNDWQEIEFDFKRHPNLLLDKIIAKKIK